MALEAAVGEAECMDSGARLPRFKSQLYHSQAAEPGVCYFSKIQYDDEAAAVGRK